jgi:hypothetical protein
MPQPRRKEKGDRIRRVDTLGIHIDPGRAHPSVMLQAFMDWELGWSVPVRHHNIYWHFLLL